MKRRIINCYLKGRTGRGKRQGPTHASAAARKRRRDSPAPGKSLENAKERGRKRVRVWRLEQIYGLISQKNVKAARRTSYFVLLPADPSHGGYSLPTRFTSVLYSWALVSSVSWTATLSLPFY